METNKISVTQAELVYALKPALSYAKQERQAVAVYLHCNADRWTIHIGDTAFVPNGILPEGWFRAVVNPHSNLNEIANELEQWLALIK